MVLLSAQDLRPSSSVHLTLNPRSAQYLAKFRVRATLLYSRKDFVLTGIRIRVSRKFPRKLQSALIAKLFAKDHLRVLTHTQEQSKACVNKWDTAHVLWISRGRITLPLSDSCVEMSGCS